MAKWLLPKKTDGPIVSCRICGEAASDIAANRSTLLLLGLLQRRGMRGIFKIAIFIWNFFSSPDARSPRKNVSKQIFRAHMKGCSNGGCLDSCGVVSACLRAVRCHIQSTMMTHSVQIAYNVTCMSAELQRVSCENLGKPFQVEMLPRTQQPRTRGNTFIFVH